MNWETWTHSALATIRASKRWREPIAFDGAGPEGEVNGKRVVSFASNDYLGLSHHASVRAAAIAAIERWGTGAAASRLVVGTRRLHLELEASLAEWQRTERAIVFASGFAANLAVLSLFGAEGTTILSDELNHASIIDGCRLAKGRVVIYRHCDLDHLGALLRASDGRKLVVSDAVFSMDGDAAPVSELAQLCARLDALLILDEAHAVLEPVHTFETPVLRVGTLSKTLGALGGWVAGSRAMIELLVNRARSFIFSTALSPADTAAALAALQIVVSPEGDRLRARLRRLIGILHPDNASPIVPIVLGDEEAALQASARLFEHGIYVPAIRPPSVPAGTARLRVALSAEHTPAMVERLKQHLGELPCQPTDHRN